MTLELEDHTLSPLAQVSKDIPTSVLEDLKSYGNLIRRMADMLQIQISQPFPDITDKIYDIVQCDTSTAVTLPIPGVLLQHAKEPWGKLTSALVSSCHLDHMYRVQQEGVEFLFVYPKLNSILVSMASKLRKRHSTPNNQKGKKIDASGRKFSLIGELDIKAMSYIVCMSYYSYALLDQLSEDLAMIPEDRRTICQFLQKEGILLGKQLTLANMLDLFAKMITSAVSLRRHAWLQSTGLQPDTKALIEDFPFEGDGLFSNTMDTILQG